MKNEHHKPASNQGNNSQGNNNNGDYRNDINTGSVGFEGDGDNGASTLRVLRKKRGLTSAKQKPLF